MEFKKILILGSAGQIGQRITSLLLSHTDSYLVMADINKNQCDIFKNSFETKYPSRSESIFLDASNLCSLIASFKNIDLVIVASSTIKYIKNIIESALINNCNLIDLQGPCQEKADIIKSYEEKFSKSQNFLITEAGAWPGLPLTMINYSSNFFDTLTSIEIFGFYNVDWNNVKLAESTMPEANKFYSENEKTLSVYKNKKWYSTKEHGVKKYLIKNIPVEFQPTYTNELQDIKDLYTNLEEFGFYINFGHPDVEKITLFECFCKGLKNGKDSSSYFTISTSMGYDLTAAATLSIIKNNPKYGISLMGDLDSNNIIKSLKKYGMDVEFLLK